MRQFGADSPEFMAFTLVGDETETVYKLPLAASLPMETLVELQEAGEAGGTRALRFQLELLKRYIGDAADSLTAQAVSEIYAAWNAESAKSGAAAGE